MSLFEYDQGHLVPAQFGHAVGAATQSEVLESVRQQVLEVIARPLFPVTWNDIAFPAPVAGIPPKTTDKPSQRLTALDGSGQVVLVEVLEKLNSQTLIASLARLGAVSNLGWNDLASAYPGGIAAFRSGWTQFRDAMPPNLTAGPRLILVAAEIDTSVRPALDALTVSGLEVHHVSVREMSNGRRFLDVQRVAASLFSHDTNLLAGRGARTPVLTSGSAEDFSASIAGHEEPLATATSSIAPGNASVSGSETAGEAQDSPASPLAPHETESPREVDEPALQTGTISRLSIMDAAKGSSVSPFATDAPEEESVQSLFPRTLGKINVPSPVPEPGEADPEAETNSADKPLTPQWQQTGVRHRSRRAAEAETEGNSEQPESANRQFVDIDGLLAHDATALEAIAQVTGEDTPIFARALLDGAEEPTEMQATLLERGVIVFSDQEFASPYEAAQATAATNVEGDAWDFWHLGLWEGPTLAEACEEINMELRRNGEANAS